MESIWLRELGHLALGALLVSLLDGCVHRPSPNENIPGEALSSILDCRAAAETRRLYPLSASILWTSVIDQQDGPAGTAGPDGGATVVMLAQDLSLSPENRPQYAIMCRFENYQLVGLRRYGEDVIDGEAEYLVFFEWDSAVLTAQGQEIVRQAAAAANHGRTTRVTVLGYTDRSGTREYNITLSRKRAVAVRFALVQAGVPAGRIVARWEGENMPLVPTADGVREPQNRRVEITIYALDAVS